MTTPDRLERRVTLRRRCLLGIWLLGFALIVGRSIQVQAFEAGTWREVAASQHRMTTEIPAPRGPIYDRDGDPIAESQERFAVELAPREILDPEQASLALREALGLSRREADRYVGSSRSWVVIPGRFSPEVRSGLGGVRGIYLRREGRRVNPLGDLAQGVVGFVQDGRGSGGIEETFEEWLQGTPGREVSARDPMGRPIPGETFVVEEPVAGGSVVLTLDADLQEIGKFALKDAIERTGARGGDLLMTDPRTGEILAMVSVRDGKSTGISGVNTPYEPGSTLKPFTVAAILESGVGRLADTIEIGDGVWRTAGRTLRDVHPKASRLTLAEALRVSSNVGVAKAASALSTAQQYEMLRDFGFGTPTGIEIPGEDSGLLRRPSRWSRQSPASLAIGYEVAVTPLQMAMAYGALANGGLLLEPRLVREVRDASGRVVVRNEPTVVRRVVSEETAHAISQVLIGVVEEGTGTRARLATFSVAGKSGTTKVSTAGGYASGRYYSSFIGFFPARDPQLVVYVKLEEPEGEYYGGAVAAPVTRQTMEAILAARGSPLDRGALASAIRLGAQDQEGAEEGPIRFVSNSFEGEDSDLLEEGDDPLPPPVGAEVHLPDLRGLPGRVAVRRLHALGLRVEWEGEGAVTRTVPGAGTRLAQGDTVRLRSRGGSGP